MMDEDDRLRPRTHEVGMPLDSLSIAELEQRIGALEAEIARLRAEIDRKSASRDAAEDVFRR